MYFNEAISLAVSICILEIVLFSLDFARGVHYMLYIIVYIINLC